MVFKHITSESFVEKIRVIHKHLRKETVLAARNSKLMVMCFVAYKSRFCYRNDSWNMKTPLESNIFQTLVKEEVQ
jgi:hypothetical protein